MGVATRSPPSACAGCLGPPSTSSPGMATLPPPPMLLGPFPTPAAACLRYPPHVPGIPQRTSPSPRVPTLSAPCAPNHSLICAGCPTRAVSAAARCTRERLPLGIAREMARASGRVTSPSRGALVHVLGGARLGSGCSTERLAAGRVVRSLALEMAGTSSGARDGARARRAPRPHPSVPLPRPPGRAARRRTLALALACCAGCGGCICRDGGTAPSAELPPRLASNGAVFNGVRRCLGIARTRAHSAPRLSRDAFSA